MPRIIRAVSRAFVLTVALSAVWASSTAVAASGSTYVPRLTRDLPADYGQLAGEVTADAPQFYAADAPQFYAADAALCSACFAIALRRHR